MVSGRPRAHKSVEADQRKIYRLAGSEEPSMTSMGQLVWAKNGRLRALAAAGLFLFAQFFVVSHEAHAGSDHDAPDCGVCITAQRDDTAIAAAPPSLPLPLRIGRYEAIPAAPLCDATTAASYSVRAPPLV